METQKSTGANTYSFQDEHSTIKLELLQVITDLMFEKYPLLPHRVIWEEFCQKQGFDNRIVDEILGIWVRKRVFIRYFESYYDLEEYNANPQWADKVDKEIIKYNFYNEEGIKIFSFIKARITTTEEEILKAFRQLPEDSIKKLLEISLKYNKMKLIDGYYHFSRDEVMAAYQWSDWKNIIKSLEDKGIICPQEYYEDMDESDDFDESDEEEDWVSIFNSYRVEQNNQNNVC